MLYLGPNGLVTNEQCAPIQCDECPDDACGGDNCFTDDCPGGTDECPWDPPFGECAGCTVANTTPQSFTMTLAGVDVTSRATTPAPYNTYFNSTSFELEQRSANPCQFRGQFTDLPADLYQGGAPIVAIQIDVEIGGGVSNTFAVTIGWYSDDACTVFVGNLIVTYTASDHAGSLAQHGGDCDTQPATATEFYRNGAADWNQAGGEIPEFTITLSPGPSLPCVPA